MKSKTKKKINIKWKIPVKWTIFGLTIGVVLATVGSIAALSGWFGGGSSIPEDTMTRGLVGYWSFDEGSGTVAHDASGYANNGVASSTWTTGKVGNALKFDGVDDSMNVVHTPSLNPGTGDFTVSAWLKPYSVSGTQRFVWKNDALATFNGYYFMLSGTSFAFGVGDGTNKAEPTGGTAAVGNWYFATGVRDKAAGKTKLYLNGAFIAEITDNSLDINYTGNLEIGGRTGASEFFNGVMDEVRIYNRALSAGEVRYHYNRGGPVAHWKMDEGEGRTVYDSTSNNNDGTLILVGSATSSAWVSGKYGSALSFDGTDDYVSVPNNSGINLTGDSSVSFWFNARSLPPTVGGWPAQYATLIRKGLTPPYAIYIYWNGQRYVLSDSHYATDGTWPSLLSVTTISSNVWYFVTWVHSGLKNRMYINGVWESEKNQAAVSGTDSTALNIGYSLSSGAPFNGVIDDVRIYNYARTPDEIRLDYNAGFAAKFGYTAAGCQKDPASCMTEGLAGYWDMDEGTGTAIHDRSDNSNNGTTTNMTTPWTSGIVPGSGGKSGGSALSFDGSDDYVDAGNGASLGITGSLTIETWVKRGVLPACAANYCQILTAESGNSGYSLVVDITTNKIRAWIGDGTDWQYTESTTALTQDVWYHITEVYDGTNIIVYVNGVQEGTPTAQSNPAAGQSLRIGDIHTGGRAFNGSIDEVRIYNRALSAEEIRYHYNKGGPVAHWKMDEGEGRTVYDSTSNNNDGTLVLAGSATSSAWVSGKYGSALSFDGVDDYITIPESSSTDFTGTFSMSYWAKFNSVETEQWLVSKGGGWNRAGFFSTIGVSSGTLRFGMGDGSAEVTADNSGFIAGAWYHIVMTYDGAVMKVFSNGILLPNKKINSYSYGNNYPVRIGGSDSGTLLPFNGLIDDVRIYNYVRTAEEIRLDYNAGLAAHFGLASRECKDDPARCMSEGLVGYWSFEEGSGTVAHDASNYANHGAASSTWATGKVGGAAQFDGVDDWVNASSTSLNMTNNLTIELWVKLSSTQLTAQYADPISHGHTGTQGWVFQFDHTVADSNLVLMSNNGTTLYNLSAGTRAQLFDDQWHHLVAVKSSNSTIGMEIYRDGVRVANNTNSTNDMVLAGTGVSIGRDPTTGTARSAKGLIDEVRIYNRVLSAEEIRYHYNKGGPVAHWKMDEGEGRTVYDSTSNNNDGTLVLVGSATSSSWVSGKYGSALSFDGTDDYVDAGSAGSSARTISFWLKRGDTSNKDVIDLGTPEIKISNNAITSTGLTLPTYYVDGIKGATTVNANEWHYITITDTANITASNVDIGKASSNYFFGLIDDVRIYNYARIAEQIRQDYNAGLSAHFK